MARALHGRYGVRFDALGANLYRDGRDSVAWHGDRAFSQIVYFTSEEAARAAEGQMTENSGASEWMAMMDGPMTFLDLREPEFV